MKIVDLDEDAGALAFARCAAEAMSGDPRMATFAVGYPAAGGLLALRWGLGDDCVAVMRLDHDFEPRIYPQFIDRSTTPKGAP